EEVPFPVSERKFSKIEMQIQPNGNGASGVAVIETAKVEQKGRNDDKNERIIENFDNKNEFSIIEDKEKRPSFETEPEFAPLPPATEPIFSVEPPPTEYRNPISADFLDTVTIKMPPISAEDLEHVEDNKLDDAYENRLEREGDNLLPIKTAARIFEVLFAGEIPASAGINDAAHGNAASAAAPAREKHSFVIPDFDTEENAGELPELPENPTEEQLLAYAHAHPLVKKALRIFRGKIVEIKKI
ncbi:MAG TPA: hypothetical protein VF692_14000, partial [Pyrinomonadaceae bacterium]